MTPNTCPKADEYRGTLIDIALDDTAHCDALKLAEVIRHVDACPHCKAELIEYQRLIASLRPRVPEVSPNMVPMLESAVRAEVARIRRRPRMLRWAAGIAAAAAILVACVLLWPSGKIEPPPDSDVVDKTPQAPTEQVAELPAAPRDEKPEAAAALPVRRELDRRTAAIIRPIASLRKQAEKSMKVGEVGQPIAETLSEAIRLATGVIAAEPDSEAGLIALYEKYRCYEMLGERVEAEGLFSKYISEVKRLKGAGAACKALAKDGYRQGRIGTALDYERFSAMLALAPDDTTVAKALYARCAVFGVSDRDRYRRELRKAIAAEPHGPVARGAYRRLISADIGRLSGDRQNEALRKETLTDCEGLLALPGSDGQKALAETHCAGALEFIDLPRAIQAYREIVRKYPERLSATAKHRLDTIRAEIMDPDRALRKKGGLH